MAGDTCAGAIRFRLRTVLAQRACERAPVDRAVCGDIGIIDLPCHADDGSGNFPPRAAFYSDLAGVEMGAVPEGKAAWSAAKPNRGEIGRGGVVSRSGENKVVVIWIDWYAYHTARFRALTEHKALSGRVAGLELVGGAGVHQGMVFREKTNQALPVRTIAPEANWNNIPQQKLARLVWRELESIQPSVVLVPGYYTAPALAAALWSKCRGRRAVLMTESTRSDHERTGWKEKLKSWMLRALFDWAVAGGTAHVRYLEALEFPSDRIARNYDVVDNEFFACSADEMRARRRREEWRLPERYFLFVGRLAQEKNVISLIDEFGAYRKNGGTWSLVIAGDGPLRKELEALVENRGLCGAVRFAGHKTSAGLIPYYAFASCFVLASTREPWGLVVNEAMAAGLPVIVSSRCGCAEDLVQPGANGFVFDPRQRGAIQDSFEAIEECGAERLVRMGRHSREIIGRYSPERWAEEVARIVAA
jgi:1,2-diacylglycerol 3-alpha-glucosyltransferase